MTRSPFDRRHAALGLLVAALTPAAAFARARDLQAEQFVQTEGQKALSVVANRALTAPARDAAFRQMIDQLADFQRITGFVLGKYARVATPEQRRQFNSVFRIYAQNLFQSHLAGFKGDRLQVTGSVVRGPGDVVVNTIVSGDASAGPLPVAWRVLGGPGAYKAVDVQTRGVWLAITLQQDFVSTIDNAGGDVAVLITRLQRETARRG